MPNTESLYALHEQNKAAEIIRRTARIGLFTAIDKGHNVLSKRYVNKKDAFSTASLRRHTEATGNNVVEAEVEHAKTLFERDKHIAHRYQAGVILGEGTLYLADLIKQEKADLAAMLKKPQI